MKGEFIMKLWKISQDVNNDWDTYSDGVVAAETMEDAQKINLSASDDRYSWAAVEDVKVEFLGEAKPGTKPGIICSSYHAG